MNLAKTLIPAVMFALAGSASGADIEALAAECDDCHGPAGVSSHADVPTIAGQTAEFIAKTLFSYQMWGRPCLKSDYRSGDTSRPKTDMCKVAGKLTEEEMDALGAHYSAQVFKSAAQEFDASMAAAGAELHQKYCESCHEQGGSVAGKGPRLAGQWVPYLKISLKYVPTGEHLVPPLMERRLADFSAEEIESLFNFYASQQD